MSRTLTETPSRQITPAPPRKRWTRSECAKLEAAGVFDQQRVELIDGELIDKMGKKRPHVDTIAVLFGWLMQVFGPRFVNPAAPIDAAPEDNSTNEPEPDLIVLKSSYSGFWSATPQPGDLELVVEVADTSLAFDLTAKAALYARAGIVAYWLVDLPGRRLIVHRNPEGGRYQSVVAFFEEENVSPLASAASSLRVGDVFPA